MPKLRPILQGTIKFRDGKKWRNKYCVIGLSPFNDALHLYCSKSYDDFAPYLNPANVILHEDFKHATNLENLSKGSKITPYPLANEAVQTAVKQTKEGLVLANKIANAISAPGPIDEINGIERGLHLHNESNVLLLIGMTTAYPLALANEEDMFKWADIIEKRLDDCHFHVTLVQTSGGNKLSVGLQAILHLQTWRVCLIAEPSNGAKFLCSWRLDSIESLQTVDPKPGSNTGLFVIEANASAEKIRGVHKFQVDSNKLGKLTEATRALLSRRYISIRKNPPPSSKAEEIIAAAPSGNDSVLNSSFDYASSSDTSMQGCTNVVLPPFPSNVIIEKKSTFQLSSHSLPKSPACLPTFDSGIGEMQQTKLVSALDENGLKSTFVVHQRPSHHHQKQQQQQQQGTNNNLFYYDQNSSTRPGNNTIDKFYPRDRLHGGSVESSTSSSNCPPVVKISTGLITSNQSKPYQCSSMTNTTTTATSSVDNEFELFPPDEDESLLSSKRSSDMNINKVQQQQPMKAGIHKRLALLFHRLNISPELKQNTIPRLSRNPFENDSKRKTLHSIIPEKMPSKPIKILCSSSSVMYHQHHHQQRRASMTAPATSAECQSKPKNPAFYATLVKSITCRSSMGKQKSVGGVDKKEQSQSSLDHHNLTSRPGQPSMFRSNRQDEPGRGLAPSLSTQTMNENLTKNRLSRLIHSTSKSKRDPGGQRFQGNLKRFLSIVAASGNHQGSSTFSPQDGPQEMIRDLPLTHLPIYRYNKAHPRWLIKTLPNEDEDVEGGCRLFSPVEQEENKTRKVFGDNNNSALPHSLESSISGMFLLHNNNNLNNSHIKSNSDSVKFRSCSLEVNSLLSSMEGRFQKSSITSPNSASECCWYDCQGSCWSLCSQPSSEPFGVSHSNERNIYMNFFRNNSTEALMTTTIATSTAKQQQINKMLESDEIKMSHAIEENAKLKTSDYCNVLMVQQQDSYEHHTLTEATKDLGGRRLNDIVPLPTSHTKDVFVTAGRIAGRDQILPLPSGSNCLPEELRDPKCNYAGVDLRPSPSNSAKSNLMVKVKCTANNNIAVKNSQQQSSSLLLSSQAFSDQNCYINVANTEKSNNNVTYKNKGDHPAYVMTTLIDSSQKDFSTYSRGGGGNGNSNRRHSHSLSSILPQPKLHYAELVQMNETSDYDSEQVERTPKISDENIECIMEMPSNNSTCLVEDETGTDSTTPLVYTQIDFARTKVMEELNHGVTLDSKKGNSMPTRGHIVQRKSICKSLKQILTKQQNPSQND